MGGMVDKVKMKGKKMMDEKMMQGEGAMQKKMDDAESNMPDANTSESASDRSSEE